MKQFIIFMLLAATLLSACGSKPVPRQEVTEKAETAGKSIPAFSADSAYSYVARQLDFGPRNPGSAGHRACADFIVESLRRSGADTVIIHSPEIILPFTSSQVKISNILARYNAGNPRRILLLAHWDTRPVPDSDFDPTVKNKPIPGANDGGSGTGVLLEVARILGQNPVKNVGVDILFVDAEDSGNHYDDMSWCRGSQEWLKSYPLGVPGVYAPQFGVLLDMVGGKDAVFHRELYSDQLAQDATDRVWSAALQAGHGSRFPNKSGSAITDDHLFFCRAGIPVTDVIENRNPSTGSFNPTWHTMHDNLDNISSETLEAVGETMINLIYNY